VLHSYLNPTLTVQLSLEAVCVEKLSKEVTGVYAGADALICIERSNSVWIWGHNVESKLGTSVLEYIITPTHQAMYQGKQLKSLSIGDAHLLAVDTSGKLYAVGSVGLTNDCKTM